MLALIRTVTAHERCGTGRLRALCFLLCGLQRIDLYIGYCSIVVKRAGEVDGIDEGSDGQMASGSRRDDRMDTILVFAAP